MVAVTGLAATLRLVAIGAATTNPFYDAAVRSMSGSWHAFFFAAFEPAGGVSVDKPPLDLWLQVLSTKLLGWSAAALVLPQALAAVVAVPLLYDLGRRLWGRFAGLAAALCLTLLPVSVLTARSDTMDSLMMLLCVLAFWLVVRAAETGRSRPLYLAAAALGLAFEVKLFEALLVLPALVLLYLGAAPARVRARVTRLAAAGAVLVLVALAWPLAISLAPASERPYTLGSSDGTIWNAIFVYNGLNRVATPSYGVVPAIPPAALEPAFLGGSGQRPGPLRLFEFGAWQLGQNFGIELAGAFAFGGLALLAAALAARRRRVAAPVGDGVPAPPSAVTLYGSLAVALWLLTGWVLFSRSHGTVHARYLESFTPAVALAFGAGAVTGARLAPRGPGWLLAFLALLAAMAGYAVAASSGLAIVVVLVAALAAALSALDAFIATRRGATATPPSTSVCAALALAVLLVPAGVRSVTLVSQNASDAGNPGAESAQRVRTLSAYLERHTHGARYEFTTWGYSQAAPLVVHDGRPVLVLMNFQQPIVSVSKLAAEVRAGQLEYALIENHCGTAPPNRIGDCPRTIQWLRHRSVDVSADAGLRSRGVLFHIVRTS